MRGDRGAAALVRDPVTAERKFVEDVQCANNVLLHPRALRDVLILRSIEAARDSALVIGNSDFDGLLWNVAIRDVLHRSRSGGFSRPVSVGDHFVASVGFATCIVAAPTNRPTGVVGRYIDRFADFASLLEQECLDADMDELAKDLHVLNPMTVLGPRTGLSSPAMNQLPVPGLVESLKILQAAAVAVAAEDPGLMPRYELASEQLTDFVRLLPTWRLDKEQGPPRRRWLRSRLHHLQKVGARPGRVPRLGVTAEGPRTGCNTHRPRGVSSSAGHEPGGGDAAAAGGSPRRGGHRGVHPGIGRPRRVCPARHGMVPSDGARRPCSRSADGAILRSCGGP